METLSNFPVRLKELMFYRDQIKSEELAAAIDVRGTSVRDWLNGTSLISLRNAIKLADFFECSLDYLSGITDKYEDVSAKPLPPFYERFEFVMKEKEFSKYRLAQETSIKDSYFSKWAKGSVPDLITVIPIAKILDVSLDYLVGRTDY